MTKKNSEYKIALFGSLAGVILTAIYDWIKEKPLLSTFLNILKWFWNCILKYEFAVWQILIAILAFIFFIYLLSKRKTLVADWLNYTQDTFDGMKWKWVWKLNSYNKYEIKYLQPVCGKCGTGMKILRSSNSDSAECPRCENYIRELKDYEKIEAIIHDNIDRKVYKN